MLWKRSIMTFNFSVFSVCVISVYSSLYNKTHPIILKKKLVSFSIYSVLLHPSLLFNPDQRMIWLLKLNQLLFTCNDYYKVQLDIWIRVQFCAFIIAQYTGVCGVFHCLSSVLSVNTLPFFVVYLISVFQHFSKSYEDHDLVLLF